MPPLRADAFPAANKIFVDREPPQRIFENAAFAIPAGGSIVRVFYGVGGQGKTALCRELWRKTAVDPSYAFVRRAELDLHGRQTDEPDLLLVWIRNGFAEAGVNLPAFDLALAITWEATRGEQPFPKLTNPWLRRTTAAADITLGEAPLELKGWLLSETASKIVGEVAREIPGVGLVPHIGRWLIDKTKRAYLERTRHELKKLYDAGKLKERYELSALLPWMLAQDLNHHLAAHPQDRFILFIDEYERVFDEAGAGARWKKNPFDSHVRTLITYTNGLLAVIFSRERLPWGDDPDWRDDLKGAQHLLGGLAAKDADDFLRAVPIEAAEIRQAIIDGAQEEPRPGAPVYPLMLDLPVEHWRTLVAKNEALMPDRSQVSAPTFEGRRREIVARVLREYGLPLQTTIERLSVARRFDRAAFEHVVKNFGTGLPLDSFEHIARLSFVTRGDDGFLTIHNAVAETIRETLDRERRDTSIGALLDHYSARMKVNLPRDVTDATVTALTEATFLRRAKGIDGFVAWLEAASDIVIEAGRYSSAAQWWRETLEVVEAALDPEHPDTATSLNNLAHLLQAQGELAGARPLYERALAIREKTLGPDHPDTATSLNNLAHLLQAQGELAGARPLYERALAIREKTVGPEHPDTAASLNNLALLLQAQGDFAGARPLYERALAIYEKALGPEHPDKATNLNNLALLLQAQGELAGARPLYERALAIREKTLGPEHPDTAASLNNLAFLLQAQGELAGARPLYERALAIYEKALGPEHPDTATNLNNLAHLLQAQGELGGARPLYERALAIYEKALGPEHPDTAASLNNLASLLRAQGDFAAARPIQERALAIFEKALGPEHPDTNRGRHNIARMLLASGNPGEALTLGEAALAAHEKALGRNHPWTKDSARVTAEALAALGRTGEAAALRARYGLTGDCEFEP